MALNTRNKEAERLASELAKRTGESKTEAVIQALRDRLARVRRQRPTRRLADDLNDIARRCAGLNVGDCFAYALSITSGEPLLFKGNDFSQTDVEAVA